MPGADQGRAAFEREAWADAYTCLAEADTEMLELDDLERLSVAAYLTGRSTESARYWERAHHGWVARGDIRRAARASFWLVFQLLNHFDLAIGSGWIHRTQRLIEHEGDCVEIGYLRYLSGLLTIFQGDPETAERLFGEALAIGEQFGDTELVTLARIGRGRCLVYVGRAPDGIALLDEAMVAVGAREISPIAVGDAYCTVIEGAEELFDLHRLSAWTDAFHAWCEAQPQLVLYRGICLMHRAELLLLRGNWEQALDELDDALRRIENPRDATVLGAAFYLRGELHRLTGALDQASDAYRQANELGRVPQPGLALLRVAQGKLEPAAATIRRVLDESSGPISRSRVLGAFVEIMCLIGDADAALTAAQEFETIASELNMPLQRAMASTALGHAQLATSDARAALATLRTAWRTWNELEIPYEAARVRMLIAEACAALGDDDGAHMERDAARATFEQLGAAPDLMSATREAPLSGLTPRELDVVRLLATGATNRAIARRLEITEKTVATHVGHVFTKLGVESRAALTAYAYEHRLLA
jgi:DNA-binding CsgD family transcriptional regulator/tetratricopeptide (TPR) repeat protein